MFLAIFNLLFTGQNVSVFGPRANVLIKNEAVHLVHDVN